MSNYRPDDMVRVDITSTGTFLGVTLPVYNYPMRYSRVKIAEKRRLNVYILTEAEIKAYENKAKGIVEEPVKAEEIIDLAIEKAVEAVKAPDVVEPVKEVVKEAPKPIVEEKPVVVEEVKPLYGDVMAVEKYIPDEEEFDLFGLEEPVVEEIVEEVIEETPVVEEVKEVKTFEPIEVSDDKPFDMFGDRNATFEFTKEDLALLAESSEEVKKAVAEASAEVIGETSGLATNKIYTEAELLEPANKKIYTNNKLKALLCDRGYSSLEDKLAPRVEDTKKQLAIKVVATNPLQ